MKQLLLSKLPALFAALAAEQKLYIPADDAAGQLLSKDITGAGDNKLIYIRMFVFFEYCAVLLYNGKHIFITARHAECIFQRFSILWHILRYFIVDILMAAGYRPEYSCSSQPFFFACREDIL